MKDQTRSVTTITEKHPSTSLGFYNTRIEQEEEPLLVVKHHRGKVMMRIAIALIALPIWGGMLFLAFSDPRDISFINRLALMFGCFLFVLMLFLFFRMVFHQEIRLYKDRIVNVQDWSTQEVKLSEASLAIQTIPFKASVMLIFKRGEGRLSRIFKGVRCDQYLMAQEDVRKLHALLAELSGRNIEEFSSNVSLMKNFIKEERKYDGSK